MTKSNKIDLLEFRKLQQQVKAELSEFPNSMQLDEARERALLSSQQSDPTSQIRSYIFLMSSLIRIQKNGKVTSKELVPLLLLAEAIVKFFRICATPELEQVMWSDLFSVKSQLMRHQGDHRMALFDQMLVSDVLAQKDATLPSYQKLALGNRYLREGLFAQATVLFKDVMENHQDKNVFLASISLSKLFRMKQNVALSKIWAEAALEIAQTKKEEVEANWQLLCIDALNSQNANRLMFNTRPKKMYRHPSYLSEAYLFSFLYSPASKIAELPKLDQIKKRMKSQETKSLLFRSTSQLQYVFTHDDPLAVKVDQVRHIYEESSKLPLIEYELMIISALERWTFENDLMSLSDFFAERLSVLKLSFHQTSPDEVNKAIA
jgi:hypothetical protein